MRKMQRNGNKIHVIWVEFAHFRVKKAYPCRACKRCAPFAYYDWKEVFFLDKTEKM